MNEKVSALADSEMQAEEAMDEIVSMLSDKEAMQAWRDYQLIGDAMRSAPNLDSAFTARLMLAIEQEPTVLAPNAMPRSVHSSSAKETTASEQHASQKLQHRLPAVWSIAASCAAVLMVGWVLLNQQLQDFTSEQNVQVASTSVQQSDTTKLVANSVEAAAVPLEYLAAHHVSAPSIGSYYIQAASYSE